MFRLKYCSEQAERKSVFRSDNVPGFLHNLYLERRMEDGGKQGDLQQKDGGQAVNEIPPPGLMAESIHADDAADASADNGNDK